MTKRDHDDYSDAWLDRLDAIASGSKAADPDDDELLTLAGRLYTELAPLRELSKPAAMRPQHTPRQQATYARATRKPAYHFSRSTVVIATLLVLVILLSIVNRGGLATFWGSATSLWHTSTSLSQLQGLSVASLPRPHDGIEPLPLLPATLPGDTQASTYGVITDTGNPNVLITFVADYHIAGQDVLLYEQPSDIPFSTSTTKTVYIGNIEGHIFQDNTGTSALQWYEHGMACQLTSTLAISRLVELASRFQPLKSWELIL